MMNPMLPNLFGTKMSASHPPETKIMLLDSPEDVHMKISEAYNTSEVAAKAVLAALRDVLFPASQLRLDNSRSGLSAGFAKEQGVMSDMRPLCTEDAPLDTLFSVGIVADDTTSYRHYSSYDVLAKDFADAKFTATQLTVSIASALNRLLDPVRKIYEKSAEWQAVDKLAYPTLA